MTSSVTGGEGPAGGHAMRNARNLLQSSALYMAAERFGRSIKLKQKKKKEEKKGKGLLIFTFTVQFIQFHVSNKAIECNARKAMAQLIPF